MKIKDEFLLREVAGSNIVVPIGDAQLSFNGVMTLNPVGAFLWKQMEEDTNAEKMLQAVMDAYEIDEETAKRDIARFIDRLREKGIIEE